MLNKYQIGLVVKIGMYDSRELGVLIQSSSEKNCTTRMQFKNETTATLLTTIHRENK